jgi:hypothetical protein
MGGGMTIVSSGGERTCGAVFRLIAPTMRQQRPNNPCILIRQRDRRDIGVAPRGQTCQPPIGVLGIADVVPQTERAPCISSVRR